MGESQDATNQKEWEQTYNWSSAGFYSSKLDNRLWVPKRPMTGSRHALNLGHPGAKMIIAGLCMVPAGAVVAVVLLLLTR